MRLPDPPLLLVTDRRQARASLPDILDAAFDAGCRWASLREKDLAADEQLALARSLHPLAQRHGARLTLHGSAEMARATGLDGVHLPSGSDPLAARRLLGPDVLIGLSVHAAREAADAPADAVDYLVPGPAFETASKPGYGPALGEKGIAAMARATRVPVIPIGGIDAANVRQMLAAGARGVAVMGGVMRAKDTRAEVKRLLAALAAAEAV